MQFVIHNNRVYIDEPVGSFYIQEDLLAVAASGDVVGVEFYDNILTVRDLQGRIHGYRVTDRENSIARCQLAAGCKV